ncbi:MAG: hypothetical protein QX199_04105 [Methylococcaceae bacterium]
MKHKKNFTLIVGIVILLTVLSEAYKKAIVIAYGQQIPEAWASDFADMNFAEIYQKIGPPQENLSAKGYQNWLIKQWWGWQMLRVDLQDCCPLKSKPTGIYYIVYVNYWYKPAYIKIIR